MKLKFDKNRYIYGCSSKEEFDLISDQCAEFNLRAWQTISVICFAYFIVLFLTTFSVKVVEANSILYISMAAYYLIACTLLFTVAKKSRVFLSVVVYISIFMLFLFGIVLGVFFSPDFLAVTFHVMVVCLPLVIADKPYRMNLMNLLVVGTFIGSCLLVKSGDIRDLDIYNAVYFGILGQFICHIMITSRLKLFLTNAEIETSSMRDALTDLYNRKAYEFDLRSHEKNDTRKNLIYVAFDVNGLKSANDTLGHEAGDELLKGAADSMNQCFAPYGKVYRTGGDEFVALIVTDDDNFEHLLKDFESVVNSWTGSYNDHLSVAVGSCKCNENPSLGMHEIAKIADTEMYKKKSQHYIARGIDRRGQQSAFAALCGIYSKILRINLTTDTFNVISIEDDEKNSSHERISEWFKDFANKGHVHPEDIAYYLEQTDLAYLSDFFLKGNHTIGILYRRRYGDEFKKVVMELLPTENYSDKNQELYLFVKKLEK